MENLVRAGSYDIERMPARGASTWFGMFKAALVRLRLAAESNRRDRVAAEISAWDFGELPTVLVRRKLDD